MLPDKPQSFTTNLPICSFSLLTCSPHALLKRIATVNGLWRNVCELGVFDDELWTTMDVAWEVLVAALAAAGPMQSKGL